MENKSNTTARDFLKNEVITMENRLFRAKIIGSSIGYLLITL